MTADPVFFKSAAAFRRWLQKNHDRALEVVVGFYRKDSGKKGISYPEALDEALCFGWIDGVRRRHDEESYVNRFSPRKKRSLWSAVNVRRAGELIAAGRMAAPGLKAFEARDAERSRQYSYERETCELPPAYVRELRKARRAWAFFKAQSPYYRRMASWFVMSAKTEETRQRRLARVIADSAKGQRIDQLAPGK
ncbi:MAG: YdeI/OmpD-associated family protein [Vicinamibacterales bacterium]